MEKSCLLIAINAKYIHTNLAVRYLKAFCQPSYNNIRLQEFSINDHIDNILKEIYISKCDIYAFSCYIWNIDMILKLCSSLRKINPKAILVLGGPEVSFDSEELMKKHDSIDYIITGEGEETLLELLEHLSEDKSDINSIAGLTYRASEKIICNEERRLLKNLDVIPFPYDDLLQLNTKIIYYETTRGCPFNCQYCLSSTMNGVRYFSMDRIKKELKLFIDSGVKQVKLVDRTFNCKKSHSLEIIKYIISQNGKTNFHFEIAADLLDEEMISVLAQAPKDMFQYEIGVQSTNPQALKEISRTMDLEKVKQNALAIQSLHNSHIHLDLIAGLPFEDFVSFHKSFDEVHELMPDMLQLGFLKLLKGSGLRARAEEYELQYNEFNPYEVLCTRWISYEELTKLKEIEHILELYYNSGRFKHSLTYIFKKNCSSYFNFYQSFSDYWKSNGLFSASQSTKELYNILCNFVELQGFMSLELNELIKLDWLLFYGNGIMPNSIKRYPMGDVQSLLQYYIKKDSVVAEALFENQDIISKSLKKGIFYEVFYTDVLESPDTRQELIIFFGKDSEGKLHYFPKLLYEIID
ncbi:MAG: B12-binding domain-containing radical SAM protein [Lutisporaceae bacterium]